MNKRYSLVTNTDYNQFYKTEFSTFHAGLVVAVQAFPSLYQKTLKEIAGFFSDKDLGILKRLAVIKKVQPSQLGETLLAYLEDTVITEIFVPGVKEVELIRLLEEVRKLTTFQRACLEIRLYKEGGGNIRHRSPQQKARLAAKKE